MKNGTQAPRGFITILATVRASPRHRRMHERRDATRREAGQLRKDVKSRGMRTTERIDLSELWHRTTTRIISPRERVVVFATAVAVVRAIGIHIASAVIPAGWSAERLS